MLVNKNSICAPTCREAGRVVPRVPNAHNLFATGSSGLRKILALDSISNGVGIQKLLAFSSTNIFWRCSILYGGLVKGLLFHFASPQLSLSSPWFSLQFWLALYQNCFFYMAPSRIEPRCTGIREEKLAKFPPLKNFLVQELFVSNTSPF